MCALVTGVQTVCSSDLRHVDERRRLSGVAAPGGPVSATFLWSIAAISIGAANRPAELLPASSFHRRGNGQRSTDASCEARSRTLRPQRFSDRLWRKRRAPEHRRRHRESRDTRSEEHTSELQSLMRISYAV